MSTDTDEKKDGKKDKEQERKERERQLKESLRRLEGEMRVAKSEEGAFINAGSFINLNLERVRNRISELNVSMQAVQLQLSAGEKDERVRKLEEEAAELRKQVEEAEAKVAAAKDKDNADGDEEESSRVVPITEARTPTEEDSSA